MLFPLHLLWVWNKMRNREKNKMTIKISAWLPVRMNWRIGIFLDFWLHGFTNSSHAILNRVCQPRPTTKQRRKNTYSENRPHHEKPERPVPHVFGSSSQTHQSITHSFPYKLKGNEVDRKSKKALLFFPLLRNVIYFPCMETLEEWRIHSVYPCPPPPLPTNNYPVLKNY